MPNYRRNFLPGGTYFFTVVTHRRRELFGDERNRALLRVAIEAVKTNRPFTSIAMVLLPDHLHCIWTLPNGDDDYSARWRQIKEKFTRLFLASGGEDGQTNLSRLRSGERAVWQRRFWEQGKPESVP